MAEAIKGVNTSIASDGNPLPLFITPKDGNDSIIFLKYWVKTNKSWLERKVLEHGTTTSVMCNRYTKGHHDAFWSFQEQ